MSNATPSVQDNETNICFEGMTSISALIESILNGESNRAIQAILFERSRLYKKQREWKFLEAKSRELGFELKVVSEDELAPYTTGTTHGGVIALVSDRTYSTLSEADLIREGFWILLDGIEDPYNFGYSIRSLYASGADGLILPPRNWLSAAGTVARSSAGTSEKMQIRVAEPSEAIEIFKRSGYHIYAAEIRNSVSLYEADLKKPLLFVIGGEKRGISREILDKCDQNIRIEYGRTFRGSLSAAATCAVIGFEVLRVNKDL